MRLKFKCIFSHEFHFTSPNSVTETALGCSDYSWETVHLYSWQSQSVTTANALRLQDTTTNVTLQTAKTEPPKRATYGSHSKLILLYKVLHSNLGQDMGVHHMSGINPVDLLRKKWELIINKESNKSFIWLRLGSNKESLTSSMKQF